MKFSVVITTYNRVDLLKRAIASALAQTVPCEVVVIDDASSDSTEAYVRSLGEQVVYYRSAENLGHSQAMNRGVQLAQGDWIKPLDDDDYLAPTCIEMMMQAISMCPNPVICSCRAAQVNLKETELNRTIKVGPGWAFYIPQADIHYGMLLDRVPFGTPAQVAFARDAFLQSKGWNSQFDVNCDDIDSWIRIAQFGDAVFVNECLAYRTIWPGAHNYKVSLWQRLEANCLVKAQIYPLVHEKYRAELPPLERVQDYIKLHWSLVAIRNRCLLDGLRMAFPGLLRLDAWKLFMQAIQFKRWQTPHPRIETRILIDDRRFCGLLPTVPSHPVDCPISSQ